jgi:hypothetical protein
VIKRIGDFMAWLGGADPAILAEAPRERARFVQMAGVLLTTAGIAILAMIFALHDGVNVLLFPSLVLGLCWGVIILNLDRFLVLSMGATRDRWTLILMAVPRLALAVVLSLVISTPLVLRVFASDISAQLYTMRLENSTKQAQLEAHSKEQQQLNQVQAQINTDNAVLSGHIEAVSSPQLQTAQAQVATLQPQAQSDFQTANRAYEAWQCELTGQNCVGSSGKTGNGPRAQAKQQTYQQAQATYNSVEAQLKQAQAAEQAAQAGIAKDQPAVLARDQQQARQALPKLYQQRNALQAYIQGATAYGTKVNQADTGILAQLQALSEASARSPSLNAARLAVLAVFFLIEILPVTIKILLNLLPPSAYEIVAKAKDKEITDVVRTERVTNRRIEEGKSRTRINVEDDMRKREESLGRQANEHVAAEMTNILDAALQEWSRQVRSTLSANGNNGSSSGPANGATPPPGTQVPPRSGLPDEGKL